MSEICNDCAKIFEGEPKFREQNILRESPNINLEKPEHCRICLLIWVRHKRATENTTAKPIRITYMLFEHDDERTDEGRDEHGLPPLKLTIEIEYDYHTATVIKVAMTAANHYNGTAVLKVLPNRTDSPESLAFLKSRLKTCLDEHQSCRQRANADSDWHPTRLIEINPTDDKVHLRDGYVSKSQPYITLSHCWGAAKPPLLKAENAAALIAGIPATDLPKTFQDAIMITRQLCASYIWIDALCIFQDNLEDWHKEASLMCDVYSHSLCNIASTGAPDGSTGLFFERDSKAECSFEISTNWSRDIDGKSLNYPAGLYQAFPQDHWVNDVELGPLNHRGWVMQERFLSTRVLHFARSQIFWECMETRSSEVFPDTIHHQAQPIWFRDSQRWLKKAAAQTQRGSNWTNEIYRGWQTFAKAYTRCELTKDEDKLVAINGIQEMMSRLTGDVFIAGLWRSHLIQELCWCRYNMQQAHARPPPEKWRAPSWSWASTNVEIHPGHIRHHLSCSDLQYRATVGDINVDATDSGQLNKASLVLRGRLFHGNVTYKTTGVRDRFGFVRIAAASDGSTREGDDGDLDLILDKQNLNLDSEGLVCMALYTCKCVQPFYGRSKGANRTLEALVLKEQNDSSGRYERVGHLKVNEALYEFYVAHETDVEHSIVLV